MEFRSHDPSLATNLKPNLDAIAKLNAFAFTDVGFERDKVRTISFGKKRRVPLRFSDLGGYWDQSSISQFAV